MKSDIFHNQDDNPWYEDGVKLVEDNLKIKPNLNTAKSAILFIGDGMGITTITATRFLDGEQKGKSAETNVLSGEVFPWSALAKIYAVDLQGTDSASTATAFLNGIKTNNGKLCLFHVIPETQQLFKMSLIPRLTSSTLVCSTRFSCSLRILVPSSNDILISG